MSNKERHIILIKKLSKGTLTSEERWELEKLSLDDPFTADALEGYYNLKEKKDLTFLHRNIDAKARTSGLNFKKVLVAASLTILLATSYFIIDFVGDNNNMSMNDNSTLTSQAEPNIEESQTILADEVVEEEEPNQIIEVEQQSKEPNNLVAKPTPPASLKPEKKKVTTGNKREQVNVDNKSKETFNNKSTKEVNEPMIAFDAMESIPPVKTIPVRGRVLSINSVPIRNAELVFSESKKRAKTNQEGEFYVDGVILDETVIAYADGFSQEVMEVTPEIDIKLEQTAMVFNQAPLKKSQTLDTNALGNLYKTRLDKFLFNRRYNCGANTEFISLQISISESNIIERIAFPNELDLTCKTTLENIIREAAFQGLFDGDKKVVLLYKVRTKQ